MTEPNVHLKSASAYWLEFQYAEHEQHGGNLSVIIPMDNGEKRVIARQAATTEAAAHIAGLLVHSPRVIVYQGADEEPGIFAMVYAQCEPGEIPPPEGEEWKGPQAACLFLGLVMRYRHDLKPGLTFRQQCEDHFAAILGGKTCEPVDKALEALMKGPPDA